MQDALGQAILFDTHKFELIESDITNKLLHKVVSHYITGIFTLYEIIGESLPLSKENDFAAGSHKAAETFMLKMQPGLSIINYQEFPILNKVEC